MVGQSGRRQGYFYLNDKLAYNHLVVAFRTWNRQPRSMRFIRQTTLSPYFIQLQGLCLCCTQLSFV